MGEGDRGDHGVHDGDALSQRTLQRAKLREPMRRALVERQNPAREYFMLNAFTGSEQRKSYPPGKMATP